MKRALVTVFGILFTTLLIALMWLAMTESGLRWAYAQGRPYLPGNISTTTLTGNLMGTVNITGLEYQQQGLLVQAESASIAILPAALLAGNVSISHLHVASLRIVIADPEKTEQTDPATQTPLTLPDIQLPWRVALADVVIDTFSLSQNGQDFALKQIRLDAGAFFNQIDINELSITADTYTLNIQGELEPVRNYQHALALDWQVSLPSSAIIKGSGSLTGDINTTRIKQQLTGPLQLTLDGEVHQLLNQLQWQVKTDVSAFDLSTLDPDLPALRGKLQLQGKGDLATASLSGKLAADYTETGPFTADFDLQRLANETIQFNQFTLHSPVNNTDIFARGDWLPGTDGGSIAIALNWQNLRWPLSGAAWFDSAWGTGWLKGDINHYQIGLATDRPWPESPPSTWYAGANGNIDGMTFDSLHISTPEGEAIITGQLDWSPKLNWQAKASVTGINPSRLWPEGSDWPGQLNASLTSNGQYENEQLSATADITQLTGKLRGYPVSLRSKVAWRDNGLDVGLFDFRSANSKASIKGRVDELLKLDWRITTPALAEIYPGAGGKLQANGNLSGPRTTPLIHAKFSGSALSLQDTRIGTIRGSLNLDLERWQQMDINLTAQTLLIQGFPLQSLTVTGSSKQIEANAIAENLTANLLLKGAADATGWQGKVERADITSTRFHNWQLRSPATLAFDANTLLTQPLCWNNQTGSLCTTVQRDDDHWQASLDAEQLSLALLTPWLPADLKLEGSTNANATVHYQAARVYGESRINLSAGVVTYPLFESERDSWEYRGGSGNIVFDDQGIKANVELAISDTDLLKASAELPGAQLLSLDRQHQALRGAAQLTVNDLGLIEALIPEVQSLKGEVKVNLATSGTLSKPRFSGDAHLLKGALQIPRLGLNINQVKLTAQSNALEQLDFQLEAHSGDGTLSAKGQTTLDNTAGWPTEITITGKEFEVSRIPEARVLVSPDLDISIKQRTIRLTGAVHIPFAKLQPKDVSTAARVSGDSVIISKEQVAVEKWNIYTKLKLTLGDRVNFFGFGFEGRFGGSLLLSDEPGQLTTATGELTVPEGRYRAYGQRLEIEQGRLLFPGGPLTNPGLDLRAVRRVGSVTAGLKVKGSLTQPQIELFSVPAMGQTDAFAYLLLGRPIENASGEDGALMAKAALALGLSGGDRIARSLGDRFGLDEVRVEGSESGEQASLVMGRYLSPKLYVSYGVGLIESVNTFSVRYQISDKWQLKGESGEAQGADLLYTIER